MLILVAWLGGVVTPVISVYQLQAVVSQCAYFWSLLCMLITSTSGVRFLWRDPGNEITCMPHVTDH